MVSTASSAHIDDADSAPPRLHRQRTWSRDADAADAVNNGATQNAASPANRRLSAPPGSLLSPWTTLQGDDLNVMAAADLLQEAMSLLSGVKKVVSAISAWMAYQFYMAHIFSGTEIAI